MNRRGFLGAIAGLLSAPALVTKKPLEDFPTEARPVADALTKASAAARQERLENYYAKHGRSFIVPK